MSKSTMGSSPRQVQAALRTLERAGFVVVMPAEAVKNAAVAAPVEAAPRTFATKAERAVGNGFHCPQCKRTDLRVAAHSGSFHEKDARSSAKVKVICTIA